MSLSPLIFWAVGFLIVSLIGLYIAYKTIKIDLDKNGELIASMLLILGTLVSVLLGLLVSGADTDYRILERSVESEATGVNEVFRLARGLPKAIAIKLQERCIEYSDRVVNIEWPAMKRGQINTLDNIAYARLADPIARFSPTNAGEANVQTCLLKAVSDIGHNRGLRLITSRSSGARRLLPLVFACVIVVLACTYLYVGRGSVLLHSVLVGMVAITLGTNIGVIFLMSRPFASEWGIQPESFQLAAMLMRRYKGNMAEIGLPDQSVPVRTETK